MNSEDVERAHRVAERRDALEGSREARVHDHVPPHAQHVRGPRLGGIDVHELEAAQRRRVEPAPVHEQPLVVERRDRALEVSEPVTATGITR
jgi:hypothetical protein